MTVGVVVLTLNGAKQIAQALGPVLASRSVAKILVVDSSSSDDTVEIAQSLGATVEVIARAEFNHGVTREFARKRLGTDIVVYLTQDVIPEAGFIEPLVAPILAGEVAVTYSRQLPHRGADFFEAFPREFNYPSQSNTRGLGDASQHGVYTFFCSDSCAAYANGALDQIGGFKATLTNEDYFAVAAMLRLGHRIGYVAESRVAHSHRYTLAQEFRRYFDTGYVRAENPWVNEIAGAAEGRGASFFREMLRRLMRQAPRLLPYAIVQTGVKWLGYRVGFHSLKAPLAWKIRCSGQPYYWRSKFAVGTAP
ncbi:MAG: glycosyltransferase [Verrucomicrobia bacterium]|nr:glycosyltransferase [Verrucomicrobiota bacterium]